MIALVIVLLISGILLAQTADHRAGLVIQFSEEHVETVCIHFSEEQISGEELLRRSGLPVVVQGGNMGAAVCQIDGQGCAFPKEPCFCKCQGPNCTYWSLQQQVDGTWRYLNQGASSVHVRDGDVYGWAWGAGSVASGAAPPVRSFAEICAAATLPPDSTPVFPANGEGAISARPTDLPPSARGLERGSPPPGNSASYIVFAVIVCLLAALFMFVRYRRR